MYAGFLSPAKMSFCHHFATTIYLAKCMKYVCDSMVEMNDIMSILGIYWPLFAIHGQL